MRLVLASASPRRADLLRAAGVDFAVRVVEVDEQPCGRERPADYVLRVARAKALAAQVPGRTECVLAADTAVVVDGLILGKPIDESDARRMLRLLSGRAHDVLTGVVLRRGEDEVSLVESTVVTMMSLTDEEIAWYAASGEPRDKAGAYAIQGLASRFVEEVRGSSSNVVGLPVSQVYRVLRDRGWIPEGSTDSSPAASGD